MASTLTRRSAQMLDRILPSDTAAEASMLGSVMLCPEMMDEVTSIVRGSDFFDDTHRMIYDGLLALFETRVRFNDITLIAEWLRKNGTLETVGGLHRLGQILHGVPNHAHAIHYAMIVRDRALKRAVIAGAGEAMMSAYDPGMDTDAVVSQLEQCAFQIGERSINGEPIHARELCENAMIEVEARLNKTAATGISSGYKDLDSLLCGMRPGQLIIIAGRPSMGKTALATNIVENVALDQKLPALLISLEMAALEVTDRLLSSRSRVSLHKLRAGILGRDDRQRIVQNAAEISQAPLWVKDDAMLTVRQISAYARRLKRKHKLACLVVDYLQLIEPLDHRVPREQQVSQMTRALKALSKEASIPVVCLAQLNRKAEESSTGHPKLSHLRESGAIEQDADVVMFIHREEYYKPQNPKLKGLAELIIAKNRNGPVGVVKLAWRAELARFEPLAPERYREFDEMVGDGDGHFGG